MTFGIDISAGQVGLDLGRARSEGVAFVISKAVAAYLPHHTVAEGYQSNIDRTIAAGLPKGHYLVPNSANTPEASAEFMAAHLYRLSVQDVLALDNEPLDTYKVFWRDADAARFFRRLNALTDHPYDRMWLYCPASLTRANGPWDEVLALGVRIWWVSYGSGTNDTHAPDHTPSPGGGITRWDVHQFTSDADVAGVDRVDGNYSPHPVGALFGGTMPNSLQGVIDYARNYPLRDGGTWASWCASFVYRAGGFSRAFPSAMAAGDNAGGLNPNWQSAPAGAIHYWAGVGGDGHCAFELGGGLLLMASSSVTDRWGTAMGTVPFSTYARMGIPYRGWSMRWGNETLSGSSTASGGYTQIGGFLMALTDQQQKELYDAVTALWTTYVKSPVARTEGTFSFRDDLVNNGTNTIAALKILNTMAAPNIDALAAAIVSKLPDTVLTKADITDAFQSLVFKAETDG